MDQSCIIAPVPTAVWFRLRGGMVRSKAGSCKAGPPALLERRFLRVPGPRPLPLGLVESADRFFDDPHVVGHGRVLLLRAWKEPTRDPDLVGEDLRPQVAEDLEE